MYIKLLQKYTHTLHTHDVIHIRGVVLWHPSYILQNNLINN